MANEYGTRPYSYNAIRPRTMEYGDAIRLQWGLWRGEDPVNIYRPQTAPTPGTADGRGLNEFGRSLDFIVCLGTRQWMTWAGLTRFQTFYQRVSQCAASEVTDCYEYTINLYKNL